MFLQQISTHIVVVTGVVVVAVVVDVVDAVVVVVAVVVACVVVFLLALPNDCLLFEMINLDSGIRELLINL